MIQTLNIKNVALIESATLNFDERLNVISGETGAGKSILLDSLSFVFGGRADRSLIRSGANSMKVEAIFSCISPIQVERIKKDFDIDCHDELFISRELDVLGKNTCKINGILVPVAIVKKICLMLVDVHGQSEHLAILDNDYQLKILDLYGKTPEVLFEKLQDLINSYKENEKEIKLLGGSEQEKQNLIDLYSYQIQEIENANIKNGEFENLMEEKKTMNQFEKINENLKLAYQSCSKSGFNESAIDQINSSIKAMNNIENINEYYHNLNERLKSALIEIQDIADTIYDDLNNSYFDEERFQFVDNRIDYLKTLFRKYGGNYENLMQYYDKTSKNLENLLNSSEKYKELMKNKENLLERIDNVQAEISTYRKQTANKFKVGLEKELKVLGMPNARIDVCFNKTQEQFTCLGYDSIEFMFSANLGFELKPLNKVVSGGEMSRVMLAYKILLSSIDEIHTIIFDEIDSGLSGQIATVVAEYMARLSINKQIISVSHLPQICAMADRNIKVRKYDENNVTKTQSVLLTGEDLYLEIARLMGASLDKKGIQISCDLKEKSNKYKNNLKNN